MKYWIIFLLISINLTSIGQVPIRFIDGLSVNLSNDTIKLEYVITIFNDDSVQYSFYYNYREKVRECNFVSFERNKIIRAKGLNLWASDFSFLSVCKQIIIEPKSSLTIKFKLNKGLLLMDKQFEIDKKWRKNKYYFKIDDIYLFKTEEFPLNKAENFLTPFTGMTKQPLPVNPVPLGSVFRVEFIKDGKKTAPIILKETEQ